MSIFNFVKKLLPRIDRGQVAEDLRITESEAIKVVKPSWEAAATHFKVNKPASTEFQALNMEFYRNFDLGRAAKAQNFIQDIARRVDTLSDTITYLRSILDSNFEKDIMSAGLTVRKAFLLRSVSNVSMITRYMLALLNYLYTAEAKHHDTTLEPGLELSRGEMKYVEENFGRFVRLFNEYSITAKEFKEIVAKTPEVYLSGSSQNAVEGLYAADKVDPFNGFGVSGFVGNPIYKIRLVVAKWQNDRYESAKAKKQQLELRLLYLEMQGKKQEDPSVATEISRLQERIEGYDRYLREVEESVEEK